MKCYLCNSENHETRHNRVRDRDDIQVYECGNCGLVYLSKSDHINDEFYEESGMLNGNVDMESYRNRSSKDDLRRFNYLKEDLLNKSILDFGCGAGGFLKLVSTITKENCGVELDKSINKALNDEGIKCFNHISEIKGKYDYITLFHVLEHLIDPINMLKQLTPYLNEGGKIIIEVPNSDDALLTLYNSEAFKNFTYWSCHLYLYNVSTLSEVCKLAGFKVNYLKQTQRYGLSNHLYWLSKERPGGHKEWLFMNDYMVDKQYEMMLSSINKCDTLFCEIEKI